MRCPAGIKITDLMYELKRMAIKYDLAPKDGKTPAMTKYFVDSVHKHGRNHEVELMAKFMLTKDWGLAFKFIGTGLKLFTAGRLPLFAKNIRGRDGARQDRRLPRGPGGEGTMRYLYYPGCSAEATGKAYDISTRAMMEKLGVELVELDDWNCCGATSYFSVRELDSFAIAARNLAIAQQQGDDELCVICNACYTTLAKTNRYMAESPEVREAVNGALGAVDRTYDGKVKPCGTSWTCSSTTSASRPCREGHAAPHRHQGGALLRLPVLAPHGRLRRPRVPDHHGPLVRGPRRRGHHGLPGQVQVLRRHDDADQGRRRAAPLPRAAQGRAQGGADVIVCACPLCEMNLEGYQPRVNKTFGTSFNIPVMYFTQLAGLAFGVEPKALAHRQADRPLRPRRRGDPGMKPPQASYRAGHRRGTALRRGGNRDMPEDKIAVYFCHCGSNISGKVDVDKVVAVGRRTAQRGRRRASTSTCARTRART